MSRTRDKFTKPVCDAIAKRAAYICSNPDCRNHTLAPSPADETKWLFVGEAAHISAASPGGPRFDPTLTGEQRSSVENGLFLCCNCAEIIDRNNGLDYPTPLLRQWKSEHEIWVKANLNKGQPTATPAQIFNVSSVAQQGGITAGVVNVGQPVRNLDLGLKTRLLELLTSKSREVTVLSLGGDQEASRLAQQMAQWLVTEGYQVRAGQQWGGVWPPLMFYPDAYEIKVGSI